MKLSGAHLIKEHKGPDGPEPAGGQRTPHSKPWTHLLFGTGDELSDGLGAVRFGHGQSFWARTEEGKPAVGEAWRTGYASRMAKLRAVKGMNDILPAEAARWVHIESRFFDWVARYGFAQVRTPIVEPTALFHRSIGDATDIVEKEMYTFEDKGSKSLTLRPEGTASCARAYLEHNIQSLEPVTKWAYSGPMYRRERPARGRYRQFHQLGCEVYGEAGPHVDAEMIDLVVAFLADIGVGDIEVLVNSLGDDDARTRYREALLAFLTPHADKLSEDSQRRLQRNPLRVLDSKAPQDQEIAKEAPQILDYLSDEDRAHFDELEVTLKALGTPYRVEPRLVRGLDYYTRTLFEIRGSGGELGAQSAVCGGGRYDGMIRELGGPKTPAIGFAMGIERLLLCMGDTDAASRLDAFMVVHDRALRAQATQISQRMRRAGLRVDADLRGGSMKSQFRRADKSGARFALVLGDSEASAGTIQVKDLEKSSQDELSIDDAIVRMNER